MLYRVCQTRWGPLRLSVGGVLGRCSDPTCGQVDARVQKWHLPKALLWLPRGGREGPWLRWQEAWGLARQGPPRACVGTVRGELLCAVRRYRDHPLSTNVDVPGRAGGLTSPGLRSGGPRAHSLGWLQPPRGPATPPSPLSTGPRTHTQLPALTQLATRGHTTSPAPLRTLAHTSPRSQSHGAFPARHWLPAPTKPPPQPARRAPDPSPNPTVKSQCKQACGLFLCRIFFSRHSLFSFSFYSKHCKYRNIFSVQ